MSENSCAHRPALDNLDGKQAVQAVLAMLQAYHERELQKLNQILSGYDELLFEKLAHTWDRLFENSGNRLQALAHLTQLVAAELDGGELIIP